MSSYLDEADSSDDEKTKCTLTQDEIDATNELVDSLKAAGNQEFSMGNFETSSIYYSQAIDTLKEKHLPENALLRLNRAAAYLSIKNHVKALHDANVAAEVDPGNWKGHWRKGVALMGMAKRPFRTKMAIKAFQDCLKCDSLPEAKRAEAEKELGRACTLMERQDAETPPADLSNCAPS
jgi:tetratricopeptide (TPR) repeat protein